MGHKRKGSSALLNMPGLHSTAAIAYSINVDPQSTLDEGDYINARLCISDCTRTVELDLCSGDKYQDATTQEQVDNALYKIDVLLTELKKLRRDYRKTLKKVRMK